MLETIKKAGGIGLLVGILIGFSLFVNWYFELEPDNKLEEAVEDIVEHVTGVEVEISE